MAKVLLGAKADVKAIDHAVFTPLHLAQSTEIAQVLVNMLAIAHIGQLPLARCS